MKDRIHIAIASYDLSDGYNVHAGTTLQSLLDHCSLPVEVHVLYDRKLSINKDNDVSYHKSCYQKIVDTYNGEIHYHHVDVPDWVNMIGAVKVFTPGSLERLFLPELLPDIDKIIYLDCDMVITTDIAVLWNTELGNTALAACLDTRIASVCSSDTRMQAIYENAGIDISNYFNSGLLVLNLKTLRELETPLSTATLTFLREHPDLPYPDQDLLNWFCQGNYLRLDEKYNVYADRNDVRKFIEDCILHYAGITVKPWKKYHGEADIPYWESYKQTPWCTNLGVYYAKLTSIPNIPVCLPVLESDFFSTIEGSRSDKLKYSMHFIFCIVKSLIKKIGNTIIGRKS